MLFANTILLENVQINLENTFESGQCFRWNKISEHEYEGVCFGEAVKINCINGLVRIKLNREAIQADEKIFRNYLDVSTNYEKILESLSAKSKFLKKALNFAPGIRILRQEPWETLCSFIISQNNNIKRIKDIIERLCYFFGKRISDYHFAFPSPEDLSKLTTENLELIRSGFRAKYIMDAARKVASGEVCLNSLKDMHTADAKLKLMKIDGVGSKVADCTLLYGYNRLDVVPKDVWMIRAMNSLFPNIKDLTEIFGEYSGIAQIYIFNYIRRNPWDLDVMKI